MMERIGAGLPVARQAASARRAICRLIPNGITTGAIIHIEGGGLL
ncbi:MULTISPECIES: hypothetical protein [Ralstonia solanacearum species complex]|nr:hypothetical protein [Ralstonia solanacearum]MDN4065679.1 hypothetical protein [Ralstonia solanacearum]